jgi:hypothetical protein
MTLPIAQLGARQKSCPPLRSPGNTHRAMDWTGGSCAYGMAYGRPYGSYEKLGPRAPTANLSTPDHTPEFQVEAPSF